MSLVFDWDDSNSLLRILNALNQINDWECTTKNLFPSLNRIIYMLMQYENIKIPKKCLNQVSGAEIKFNSFRIHIRLTYSLQFTDLPEKWCALLKTASIMKYQIVPIQAHQIDLISKRIAFFNQLSKHYRQEFVEQKVWMN